MFIYKNDTGGDHLVQKGRLLTKRHSQESLHWKGGAYWKEGTKLNHYSMSTNLNIWSDKTVLLAE